jgi:hypothetical protein
MFWGCFSYNHKGPCHIWHAEIKAECAAVDKDLTTLNKAIEPIARVEWELENSLLCLGATRNYPGRKPKWQFTWDTGKLTRGSGTGIDWYRYKKEILEKKLIPFAQHYACNRLSTIVQEDRAPAHVHHHQATVYAAAKVQ